MVVSLGTGTLMAPNARTVPLIHISVYLDVFYNKRVLTCTDNDIAKAGNMSGHYTLIKWYEGEANPGM